MATAIPPHPPGCRLPDYNGGSIVNLASSIEQCFGGHPCYPALRAIEPNELEKSKSVILLVLDGMGQSFFDRHAGNDLKQRFSRGPVTSVFPSTTAAAMTSLYTGRAPADHGILAWFTYFKEIGGIATVPPMIHRPSGTPIVKNAAERLIDVQSMFQRVRCNIHAILPKEYKNKPYSTVMTRGASVVGYKSLGDLVRRVTLIAQRKAGKHLIIAYWPGFDATCHEQGKESRVAIENGRTALKIAANLLEAPWLERAGTTVVITADHGQVSSPPSRTLRLERHPALHDSLVLPFSGEPRAAFCYLRHGRDQRFFEALETLPDGCCTPVRSEDAIAWGWFGNRDIHPKLRDRTGDVILLMHENYTIKDVLLGEERDELIGYHGGMDEEEMLVPLLIS